MAKDVSSLSLADLENLIGDRQTKIEGLLKKRDELQAEVDSLDYQIQDFLTTGGVGRRMGRKRPKNEAPLRTVMMGILGKNKKGLSLHNLAEQIKATGYKSHSHNFKNVVYQCLYNTKGVIHDDATGLYRIKR